MCCIIISVVIIAQYCYFTKLELNWIINTRIFDAIYILFLKTILKKKAVNELQSSDRNAPSTNTTKERSITFIKIDFLHNTMNVYFILTSAHAWIV